VWQDLFSVLCLLHGQNFSYSHFCFQWKFDDKLLFCTWSDSLWFHLVLSWMYRCVRMCCILQSAPKSSLIFSDQNSTCISGFCHTHTFCLSHPYWCSQCNNINWQNLWRFYYVIFLGSVFLLSTLF
jgi:hypothetical protein